MFMQDCAAQDKYAMVEFCERVSLDSLALGLRSPSHPSRDRTKSKRLSGAWLTGNAEITRVYHRAPTGR